MEDSGSKPAHSEQQRYSQNGQFGDGYKQVSGSGLNDEVLNYAFSFTGDPVIAREIHSFLRRHKTKSFTFTPPGGDLALWRVEADSLQRVTLNKKWKP
jgi:phage-related protein